MKTNTKLGAATRRGQEVRDRKALLFYTTGNFPSIACGGTVFLVPTSCEAVP